MLEPSLEHDVVARQIVDAAFAVHSVLGPGLLEAVYEQCLAYELETREIPFRRQVVLPICYRGRRIDAGFRMDMVVCELVVVEIKAVERLLPIHEAQLATYLRLSRLQLRLLINFNVILIKQGIRRRINNG
ncbi:GxxExxY protein [Rhodopila globiformis]|uniref:GxxExxY protein n=1 Tax=Rhodopila globiformis TaxID=1071 RepID=A0A2S6MY55_RHOGL|nr:GxxExxY protein [Rhodopila globiformis]